MCADCNIPEKYCDCGNQDAESVCLISLLTADEITMSAHFISYLQLKNVWVYNVHNGKAQDAFTIREWQKLLGEFKKWMQGS